MYAFDWNHGELPSGPFIWKHILMSQTQKERQEARSALNTVISSSKRTTRVSSTSPPLGRPSPCIQFLSSSKTQRVEGWPLLGQPTGSIDGRRMEGWRAALLPAWPLPLLGTD